MPASALLLALPLLLAPEADAAKVEQLRSSWPMGEERRVHVRSTVAMPQMLRIELPNGTGARVTVIEVEYVARCVVDANRTAEWALTCPLEAVRFAAQPIREEQDRAEVLERIFENYAWRLEEAFLQVELGKDGRLRHFDLENVRERMLGDRQETELMRRLFRQGFAGLELIVPIRATGKEWESRNPRLAEHIAWPGTNGHTQMSHRITDRDGDRVWVESEGEGTMKPGPSRFLSLETFAEVIFNTDMGTVEEARWAGFATPLPSHIYNWNELTRPYLYWGQGRIAPLDAPVHLEPSGPLALVPVPDELTERLAASRRAQQTGLTGGVLAPPGREPVEHERMPYLRLGAMGGVGGAASNTVGIDVGGGLRWRRDILTEVGGRVGLGLGDPPADQPLSARTDHDAFLSVAWSPQYRFSPRIGLMGGASYRRYDSGYPEWAVVPFAGVEFGVRSQVGHGIWIDTWLRSTADAARFGPKGLAQWGGSTDALFHRAGVSLVLGPGPDRGPPGR